METARRRLCLHSNSLVGVWAHVCIKLHRVTSRMSIYLNGAVIQEKNYFPCGTVRPCLTQSVESIARESSNPVVLPAMFSQLEETLAQVDWTPLSQ